jgi:hypothetical protein
MEMIVLRNVAPHGRATDYDRQQLALYAALLDAEASGEPWLETAVSLMGLDPSQDGTEECWHSHLDRAHWIIGEGLGAACDAFGSEQNLER